MLLNYLTNNLKNDSTNDLINEKKLLNVKNYFKFSFNLTWFNRWFNNSLLNDSIDWVGNWCRDTNPASPDCLSLCLHMHATVPDWHECLQHAPFVHVVSVATTEEHPTALRRGPVVALPGSTSVLHDHDPFHHHQGHSPSASSAGRLPRPRVSAVEKGFKIRHFNWK